MLKAVLKKFFPGVSWQNPILNSLFKLMNPADYVVRATRGLAHLPPYAVRVRSNGVTKQFGGQNFNKFGHQLAEHLQTYAGLNRDSQVLEIGCGCGRTAFALADSLANGNFVGMDIHKISIEACENTAVFTRKQFRFDYLDVHNNEYNPEGTVNASSYTFPYEDGSFDVVFLVSVFTHMPSADVRNYIAEIARMLKLGGVCMITTFLMDHGQESNGLSFPFNEDDHYFHNQSLPEMAVGYYLDFYERNFEQFGLKLAHDPLLGEWRQKPEIVPTSHFGQDIIFFKKEA